MAFANTSLGENSDEWRFGRSPWFAEPTCFI